MKRGSIFSILLIIGCVHQSFAETFGSFEYTINAGEITITKFLCDTTDGVIPATIAGLPVTTIGDEAFQYCTSLVSVSIPDSVTGISGCSFFGCTSALAAGCI